MKYLFVHQNFPGQYLHIVRHLLAQKQHDIVFISLPNQNNIPGVRKVAYQMTRPNSAQTHHDAQEFELAGVRAETVARTARTVKALGFAPDIVIGHHGWGEMLNMQDVFPDTPLLGYHEFYYHTHGVDVGYDPEFPMDPGLFPRIRAKNAVNLLALTNPGHGQSPTQWQRSTYPEWARHKISLLPEGVNLDACRADPAVRRAPFVLGNFTVNPKDKLVTYVARDLEPYRGFHVIMRALPAMLKARKDLRVVMVGGDGVSYGARLQSGTWREHLLRELGDGIDRERVHFPGKVEYETYLRLLQRSDAHIYLTYPFVASWSLREALSCGCAIVASDTTPVHEFITHGENGLLTPCLDPAALATTVLDVLEKPSLANRLRANARRYAEKHLAMADYLAAFETLIGKVIAGAA